MGAVVGRMTSVCNVIRCSVLQCMIACCNVLQRVVSWCSV